MGHHDVTEGKLQLRLPALGWEIPGDFGVEAGGGLDLRRGKTSVEYNATEPTFQSSHFVAPSTTLCQNSQGSCWFIKFGLECQTRIWEILVQMNLYHGRLP